MASESAALLTKTQRRRIRDRFSELDGAQTRRDRQRIRERVAAGVGDLDLLAGYPDEQLELAFDDRPDEDLVDDLAAGHLVLERVREIRGLDRGRIVRRAGKRARSETASPDGDDLASLEGLPVETSDERRERDRPSAWERRATRLRRVALGVLVPATLLWGIDRLPWTGATPILDPLWVVLFGVVASLAAAVVAIRCVRLLKYALVSPVRTVAADPEAAIKELYERVVLDPIRLARRSWDEL
jgi:hypothetical protein